MRTIWLALAISLALLTGCTQPPGPTVQNAATQPGNAALTSGPDTLFQTGNLDVAGPQGAVMDGAIDAQGITGYVLATHYGEPNKIVKVDLDGFTNAGEATENESGLNVTEDFGKPKTLAGSSKTFAYFGLNDRIVKVNLTKTTGDPTVAQQTIPNAVIDLLAMEHGEKAAYASIRVPNGCQVAKIDLDTLKPIETQIVTGCAKAAAIDKKDEYLYAASEDQGTAYVTKMQISDLKAVERVKLISNELTANNAHWMGMDPNGNLYVGLDQSVAKIAVNPTAAVKSAAVEKFEQQCATDNLSVSTCLDDLAVTVKDTAPCEKIQDKTWQNGLYTACITDVAKERVQTEICAKLKNENEDDQQCISQVAVANQRSELCDLIKTDFIKKNCVQNAHP